MFIAEASLVLLARDVVVGYGHSYGNVETPTHRNAAMQFPFLCLGRGYDVGSWIFRCSAKLCLLARADVIGHLYRYRIVETPTALMLGIGSHSDAIRVFMPQPRLRIWSIGPSL